MCVQDVVYNLHHLDYLICITCELTPLQWRHNEHDGVSNHQPNDCLLNCLFRRRSKKRSKLRVTGLCAGNSLVTGESPAHRWPFDDVIMQFRFCDGGSACIPSHYHHRHHQIARTNPNHWSWFMVRLWQNGMLYVLFTFNADTLFFGVHVMNYHPTFITESEEYECMIHTSTWNPFMNRDLAPVPLSIFRSNSKFDENSKHSSVKCTRPITTIFSHVTTVSLSWRVQNIVEIGWIYLKLERSEFSSNFEFDQNMLSGTGASEWINNHIHSFIWL